MNDFQNNLAIFIILFSSTALIFLIIFRKKYIFNIIKNPAFNILRKYIGISIEQGKNIHMSIGNSGITEVSGASSLLSLSILDKIYQLSSMSDKPPIVTSGSGDLSILSKDIIHSSYRKLNALERYIPDNGYLTGPTRFSYVAGAMPESLIDDSSTLILVGNLGPEVILLTDAARRKKASSFGSTNTLLGQAAIFAGSDETLIGENLFAIPGSLSKDPIYDASLHVHDLLRWITIMVLVLGSVIKLFGII
jgi:hypothetical protein